jgi:hypothetical protein
MPHLDWVLEGWLGAWLRSAVLRKDGTVENWLVERFTHLGVTFQNWMIVALAIIVVGALVAWWGRQ